ncbi:hypothetical protein M440DRAFT_265875 [Trichoderma longibrachiatum ATCC 18648]|uniref:Uncharacterized protein n=1 Tax=Trichoderma longibrachiatum ATCC 18648 TaxID=983965 RepID=A0A2T4CAK4_TRILO|nr:hypothetical protein M440DRAFT_265875 [Trichoderma longibrachiatum ATCC 18648]
MLPDTYTPRRRAIGVCLRSLSSPKPSPFGNFQSPPPNPNNCVSPLSGLPQPTENIPSVTSIRTFDCPPSLIPPRVSPLHKPPRNRDMNEL